jgi:hypothetical protein
VIWRGLGTVGVVVLVVVVFLPVNGGYVYRTKCPLASGGTQTKWTYGIDDILPYIRSTSPPCHSHTGTRLVISAMGISPIHDDDSTAVSKTNITPADKSAAEALATATSSISAEYDRERRAVAPLQAAFKSQGLTPELRQKFIVLFETALRRYLAIKQGLDRSRLASDPQLLEANRLLSLWLARQIEVDRVFLTSKSTSEFDRRTRAVAEKIAPVTRRLDALSVEIQAKYPNVTDWGFLHNS